ncbi:MAG: hypothetical protein AB1468_03960 [Candidatus Micrarchaeota archaeon]
MGFLDFLKKGKGAGAGEEPGYEIDLDMKSSEEKYEEEVERAELEKKAGREAREREGGTSVSKIEVQLESLRAQIDALRELRVIMDEKFSRVSEEIGELRAMLVEEEKEGREIRTRAEAATSLIEAVQPEKLMGEVRKLELKLEQMKNVQERLESIQVKATDEIKEVKSKLTVFKGVDTVVQLNDEVKKELAEIKKTESDIMRHADKVEYIFVDFQKKFVDIQKMFDHVDAMDNTLKDTVKQADQLRVKLGELPPKQEFENIKKDMGTRVKAMDEFLAQLQTVRAEIKEARTKEMNELRKDVADMMTILERQTADFERKKIEIATTLGDVRALTANLQKEVEAKVGGVHSRVENMEAKIETLEKRTPETLIKTEVAAALNQLEETQTEFTSTLTAELARMKKELGGQASSMNKYVDALDKWRADMAGVIEEMSTSSEQVKKDLDDFAASTSAKMEESIARGVQSDRRLSDLEMKSNELAANIFDRSEFLSFRETTTGGIALLNARLSDMERKLRDEVNAKTASLSALMREELVERVNSIEGRFSEVEVKIGLFNSKLQDIERRLGAAGAPQARYEPGAQSVRVARQPSRASREREEQRKGMFQSLWDRIKK